MFRKLSRFEDQYFWCVNQWQNFILASGFAHARKRLKCFIAQAQELKLNSAEDKVAWSHSFEGFLGSQFGQKLLKEHQAYLNWNFKSKAMNQLILAD